MDKDNEVIELASAFLDVMDYFSGKPHEVMAHCGCSEERAKQILAIAAKWSSRVEEDQGIQ